jgi:hypothetical protein
MKLPFSYEFKKNGKNESPDMKATWDRSEIVFPGPNYPSGLHVPVCILRIPELSLDPPCSLKTPGLYFIGPW